MFGTRQKTTAEAAPANTGTRTGRRHIAWLTVVALVGGFFAAVVPASPAGATDATRVEFDGRTFSYGQDMLLSASVYDDSTSCTVFDDCDPPDGFVAFRVGATELGTAWARSPHGQRHSTAPLYGICCLPAGTHTITATFREYGNDGDWTGSSAQATFTVRTRPTSGSIVQSVNGTSPGQSVTFTATVVGTIDFGYTYNPPDPRATLPTGRVTFYSGSNVIAGADLAEGVASLTTSSLPPGEHGIEAFYAGDPNYRSQSIGHITHTVSNPTSGVTLTITPGDVMAGENVTFQATVTGGTATPTGVVLLERGGALVQIMTLGSTGTASFTAVPDTTGNLTYTAEYGGDANYNGSRSSATVVVRRLPTLTQLVVAPDPSSYGEDVTLTAIVVYDDLRPVNTSTVKFFIDGNQVGPPQLLDNGYAHLTVPALAVGAHTVSVYYEGDYMTARSERSLTHTVEPAATSLVLTLAPSPSQSGDTVTLTATVSAPAASGPPTGVVYFAWDDLEVATPVELNAKGVATYKVVLDEVRGHTVAAHYIGDDYHMASSADAAHTVRPAVTAVALAAAPNPTIVGQPVTVTAVVSGGGSTAPSGTLTFFDGTTSLGSQPVGPGGTTTLTTTALAVGTHELVAVYGGDATHAGSQASVSQSVLAAATAVAVTTAPNPSLAGESVTLSATVASAEQSAGAPTGTVTFLDGATELGAAAVGPDGVATLQTAALAAGVRTIAARYGGDANHRTSETSTTHTVNKRRTRLVAEPALLRMSGLALTLRMATTLTDVAGTPTAGKAVRFVVAGTTVCTATTNAQGHAVCTTGGRWLLALINGDYDVHYAGDATYLPSADHAGLFQT